MNILDTVTLFGIIAALAAMPGASVALVVTRSATRGLADGVAVAIGIVLGDMCLLALAILGLSIVAETLGELFAIVRILAGLYLLWLGFSLLRSSNTSRASLNAPDARRGLTSSLLAGFLLTLGDIKAIAFYASLMPAFVDLKALNSSEILAIMIVTACGVGGVKLAYALLANKIVMCAPAAGLGGMPRRLAGGIMLIAGGYLIVGSQEAG